MTIQEIMERSGVRETNLAIAWIRDAIHLIQSNGDDQVATWKTDITDTVREYPFPANLIKLKSLSVLDTSDDKYKRIRRLTHQPTVSEDTDPD
jgi:hypothetical protein